MASGGIQRLNYYNRQFLGVEDFKDQQDYHRDMRRRHNVGPHTWGIVAGLDLRQADVPGSPGEVDVTLDPGLAVDGFGREIVVLEPLLLTAELFAAFTGTGFRKLYIAYDEELAKEPRSGFEPCDGDRFTRRSEGYRLVVDPPDPTRDEIIVAGTPATAPADFSIPYQEFPEDDDGARWLVFLGRVIWDGTTLRFMKADPQDVVEGRPYAGAIAAQILSPAGKLLLRGRQTPIPMDPADPGIRVQVAGSLQSDRRLIAKDGVELHGGALDFRNDDGVSPPGQFAITRVDPGGAAGVDLRVKIGAESAGKNRLLIASNSTKVTITDQGDVTMQGRATIRGGFDAQEDSVIGPTKTLTLEGGRVEFKKPGAADSDWSLRVSGDNLQFVEPDDGDRVSFEVLDTSSAETSPCIRLHGNSQATLSAAQLVDLTNGGVTSLHRHPLQLAANTIVRTLQVPPNSSVAQTVIVPAPQRNAVAAIFLTSVDASGIFSPTEHVTARITERNGAALPGTPAVFTGPVSSLTFQLESTPHMSASAVAVVLFDDAT